MKWETISLSKNHGQQKETIIDQQSSLQKPLMDVTSWATCKSWEQPLNDLCDTTPSEGMEWNWFALPVTSFLESYLLFKTPGKPHYLHNHPKHPQCRIFAQFPKYTLYLCWHFIPLNAWFGGSGKQTSVTLNNSHLLNAYYVPATVGEAWETFPNSH